MILDADNEAFDMTDPEEQDIEAFVNHYKTLNVPDVPAFQDPLLMPSPCHIGTDDASRIRSRYVGPVTLNLPHGRRKKGQQELDMLHSSTSSHHLSEPPSLRRWILQDTTSGGRSR